MSTVWALKIITVLELINQLAVRPTPAKLVLPFSGQVLMSSRDIKSNASAIMHFANQYIRSIFLWVPHIFMIKIRIKWRNAHYNLTLMAE